MKINELMMDPSHLPKPKVKQGTLALLSDLSPTLGAALILPDNKVYLARYHYMVQEQAKKDNIFPGDIKLTGGAIRVRYRGSLDGFNGATTVEFASADNKTINSVKKLSI